MPPVAASDIPADANVRFGVLPNGMQYAILHNATPAGQASLRLRIDAGSLMENDNQRGLAHFMEHMAFNGTTNIPENDLLRILERLGLAFGADTNASTGFDQTVVRGNPDDDHFSVLYYAEGRLIAIDTVNDAPDYMVVRRALGQGATIPPELASDTSVTLKSLLVPAAA